MQVRVLPFGILKDWLGESTVNLPDGATVAALLRRLASGPAPVPAATWASIAVSVNHEYAQPTRILCEGDEVGLLPPVSGGANDSAETESAGEIRLTRDVIQSEKLVSAAKHGSDGAVVVFDGIVRNNTRGRQTLHLDYEAYEEMALREMNALADQARQRFNVRHISIVHRLGRLMVGETSVLIVVASAHRAQAYEASRWLIDTLKRTVPIWKKETFVDGQVWADGEPFPESIAAKPPEAPHAS
ncbi:MAG: molybdenum cofactor biosynthesis protein MoaE [Terracidiphilus sp.]